MTVALRRIQSKLDRWELEHLRQLAADLAERLEAAEAAAGRAEDAADFWRDQALAIELRDDEQLGMTVAGSLVVLRSPVADACRSGAH